MDNPLVDDERDKKLEDQLPTSSESLQHNATVQPRTLRSSRNMVQDTVVNILYCAFALLLLVFAGVVARKNHQIARTSDWDTIHELCLRVSNEEGHLFDFSILTVTNL